jgi:hypothetical protein
MAFMLRHILTQLGVYTRLPIKQAVISASALSLLYPSEPIPGYSREMRAILLIARLDRLARNVAFMPI